MVNSISSKLFLIKSVYNPMLLIIFISWYGCSSDPPATDISAINNRPQLRGDFIAIAKLQHPSLYQNESGSGSVAEIDQVALAAIEQEQEAFISQLKEISDEIRLLYSYRFVLNGVALVVPKEFEAPLRALPQVVALEGVTIFDKPDAFVDTGGHPIIPMNLGEQNSVSFIGAHRVHREVFVTNEHDQSVPVRGLGVSVGVIDSGIDYTHSMFGGVGDPEVFASIDPNLSVEAHFPNSLIVGGIDLVGSDFHAGAADPARHIPIVDANPIDEGGHGSHVAGSIAGQGDGVNTYDGVAPDAVMHAIKVFGANGSTNSAVVIAALEYSANPSGDLVSQDRLDVLNLSLGSPHGEPQILYNEAITNASRGGMLVIASGGNSGPLPYIVGSPGISDAAISVAASLDYMPHNWQFGSIELTNESWPEPVVVERVEGSFTKPVAEAGEVSGKFVYIGLANQELTPEQIAELQGNVALIDRGEVTFYEKILRAQEAGAIGAVVVNHLEGEPTSMGGSGDPLTIPGVMIAKSTGDLIKAAMDESEVIMSFNGEAFIEKPWLIDTLTGFSSRGPRGIDSAIKPEVAAPGLNIISADIGKGDKGTRKNGTSMSAPHIAGVAALIRQVRPEASTAEVRSRLMNTATPIGVEGQRYGIALQGGGRVDAYAAVTSPAIVEPAAFSLGRVGIGQTRRFHQEVTVTNTSAEVLRLNLDSISDPGMRISTPPSINIDAGASKSFTVSILLNSQQAEPTASELNGWLKLSTQDDQILLRVPVLAVIARETRITATRLVSQGEDKGGLELSNQSPHDGQAYFFNLLGRSPRQSVIADRPERNTRCDLQAAGYRIGSDEQGTEYLEFAVKLYQPVSTWNHCEVSVQFRSSRQGKAEQELLAEFKDRVFSSRLYDASEMRRIRAEFEQAGPDASDPNYDPALLSVAEALGFEQSTVAILKVELDAIVKAAEGNHTYLKLAVLPLRSAGVYGDDFLAGHQNNWRRLALDHDAQPFVGLSGINFLQSGETKRLEFSRGSSSGSLMLLAPHNFTTLHRSSSDQQMRVFRLLQQASSN